MAVIVDKILPCGAHLRIHDDYLVGVSEAEMKARRDRLNATARQVLMNVARRQADEARTAESKK